MEDGTKLSREPATAEDIAHELHLPTFAVRQALRVLRKLGLATETPEGWVATSRGRRKLEEET